MSRLRISILVFVGLVAGVASGETPAWLEPSSDYRADTLMSSPDGEMRGQVWASGRKERREFTLQGRRQRKLSSSTVAHEISAARRMKDVSPCMMRSGGGCSILQGPSVRSLQQFCGR